MREYEMIYRELCERVENGELTCDEAYLINERAYDQYVIERKKLTTTDRHMSKFKKKYNFVPDANNKNTGQITVDGRQYPIDLDINNPFVNTINGDLPRNTITDLSPGDKQGKIFIDKKFMNLKPKQSDAILQHEIGHNRIHSMSSNTPNLIKNAEHMGSVDTQASGYARAAQQIDPNVPKKAVKKIIRDAMLDGGKDYKKRAKNVPENIKKSRGEMYSYMKKYTSPENEHINQKEFEADRYAVNHSGHPITKVSGKSQLKRGLRNIYKQQKNSISKHPQRYIPDGIDMSPLEYNRRIHVAQTADYEKRSKALNDKRIAEYPLYKQ